MPSNRPLAGDHSVQFYASEQDFARRLSSYVCEGLEDGDGLLGVLTISHQCALKEALAKRGYDVERAIQRGRLKLLDASDALTTFFKKGSPSPETIELAMGPLLDEVSEASRNGRVRTFGEVVSLLARSGRTKDAIYLERAWAALQESRQFSLCCLYRLQDFPHTSDHGAFLAVCDAHERVYPATPIAPEADVTRLAARIAELEHLASCAELEAALRVNGERELREAQRALALPTSFRRLMPTPAVLAEVTGILSQLVVLTHQISSEPVDHDRTARLAREMRVASQRAASLLGSFGRTPDLFS